MTPRMLLPAVVAAALLAACSRHEEAPVPVAAPNLETVTVQSETLAEEQTFDGVLEAVFQSTVAAQTNARVEAILVDVGDYVEQGQVIVRFRGTEQRARLSGAEAGVREAQARYGEALQEHGRVKDLFAKGVVAKAMLDRASAALDSAKARLEAARAAAGESQEQAGNIVVRAPFSGIVVKRLIEVGETATVGRPLMSGLSLEHLRAAVEVPQSAIAALRAKKAARVIMPGGQSVEAQEIRLSPSGDPQTHTFHVQVTLPQASYGVYPGTLVKVAFTSGEQPALLLPPTAILNRNEVAAVYVLGADNRLTLRYLRLGTAAADGRVPVLAGLDAGERVARDAVAAAIAFKKQTEAKTS